MNKSEIIFLEGPHSRWKELKFTFRVQGIGLGLNIVNGKLNL